MKILCLLTEDPFPPRSGITIPTFNHLNIFKKKGHELAVLVTSQLSNDLMSFSAAETVIPVRRSNFLRVIQELLLKSAYFDILLDYKTIALKYRDVEAIYYSPISLGASANLIADEIERVTGKKVSLIAAVSDCYTSVLRTTISSRKTSFRTKDVINYIRSFIISTIESRILDKASSILAQTPADRDWFNDIGLSKEKLVVLPNGVNQELFNIDRTREFDLVFVGDFKSDFYIEKLDWFVEEVFKKLVLEEPSIHLHVYTSGVKNKTLQTIAQNNENVSLHENFVANITDVYRNKGICIAPIFKKYGFINKVAEAMSAGLIVVGDESAFNSMHVASREHVLIARSSADFYESIKYAIEDIKKGGVIGNKARVYGKENFSWASREEVLDNALHK